MNIETDKVYLFKFKPGFESLDGIYKVTHQLNYEEILEENIDLYKELYEKVNKTRQDLDQDIENYKDDVFFKLEKPGDTVEPFYFYIPETLLNQYPDSNVAEYNKVMMTIDLGLFANPDILTSLITAVSEIISTNQGITVQPVLMTYGKQWMLTADYEQLEQNRENAKGNIINYFSECNRLTDELNKAQARIQALEDIIKSL